MDVGPVTHTVLYQVVWLGVIKSPQERAVARKTTQEYGRSNSDRLPGAGIVSTGITRAC